MRGGCVQLEQILLLTTLLLLTRCLQLEQVAVDLRLLSAPIVEEGLELELRLLRARRVRLLREELQLTLGPPGGGEAEGWGWGEGWGGGWGWGQGSGWG